MWYVCGVCLVKRAVSHYAAYGGGGEAGGMYGGGGYGGGTGRYRESGGGWQPQQ